MRKRDEWNSLMADFLEHPQKSADHLVLGMNKEQRDKSRGHNGHSSVPTWF